LPLPSDARARHVIGLGLVDALSHAVPELAPADYPRMVERYRHHYLSSDRELSLFPGIFEMIAGLAGAGRLLAVATGKSRVGPAKAGSDWIARWVIPAWVSISIPAAVRTSASRSRIRRCWRS